jgi:hypothetical protein
MIPITRIIEACAAIIPAAAERPDYYFGSIYRLPDQTGFIIYLHHAPTGTKVPCVWSKADIERLKDRPEKDTVDFCRNLFHNAIEAMDDLLTQHRRT